MAGGWWQRAAAAPRRARDAVVALADALPPARVSPRPPGRRARRRIGARRRADGGRLAAAGDPVADRRARVAVAGAGRGDPRARARAHPPPRLRGQRAADDRRDAAVLSPGGVVAVDADPRRTRTLLRRHRGRGLRRPGRLRAGARRSRKLADVGSPTMAMAATGGSLLDRVRRILHVPIADEPRSPSWAVTLALTMIFTAGAGSVQHLPWQSGQRRRARRGDGRRRTPESRGGDAAQTQRRPRADRAASRRLAAAAARRRRRLDAGRRRRRRTADAADARRRRLHRHLPLRRHRPRRPRRRHRQRRRTAGTARAGSTGAACTARASGTARATGTAARGRRRPSSSQSEWHMSWSDDGHTLRRPAARHGHLHRRSHRRADACRTAAR